MDWRDLETYSEGVIARTAMPGGSGILSSIEHSGNPAEPIEAFGLVRRLMELYPGRLYLELAFHGQTTTEVLAFYKYIRRRYPDYLRIYLVNDNLSLHWTPLIREWAASHNVELVPTPTSASHPNRIECHFRPLREFVLNASDDASHADVAVAFRRYLRRRNTDYHTSRIRLLESRSRIA